MITAKVDEANAKFVKEQAVTTRRIQELVSIVERLRASDKLFKRQVKKIQEELGPKQDGYKGISLGSTSSFPFGRRVGNTYLQALQSNNDSRVRSSEEDSTLSFQPPLLGHEVENSSNRNVQAPRNINDGRIKPTEEDLLPSLQLLVFGRGVGDVLNINLQAPRTKNEVGIKLTEEESFPSLHPLIFGRGVGDTYLQALRHRNVCATSESNTTARNFAGAAWDNPSKPLSAQTKYDRTTSHEIKAEATDHSENPVPGISQIEFVGATAMDTLQIPLDDIGSRSTTNILPRDFDHEREESKTDRSVEKFQVFIRVKREINEGDGKKPPSIQKDSENNESSNCSDSHEYRSFEVTNEEIKNYVITTVEESKEARKIIDNIFLDLNQKHSTRNDKVFPIFLQAESLTGIDTQVIAVDPCLQKVENEHNKSSKYTYDKSSSADFCSNQNFEEQMSS